jgi:hypothetical protein
MDNMIPSAGSSTSLLRELIELGTESEHFRSQLGSILQSRQRYNAFASTLQEEERKSLIELLDRVSLRSNSFAFTCRCFD